MFYSLSVYQIGSSLLGNPLLVSLTQNPLLHIHLLLFYVFFSTNFDYLKSATSYKVTISETAYIRGSITKVIRASKFSLLCIISWICGPFVNKGNSSIKILLFSHHKKIPISQSQSHLSNVIISCSLTLPPISSTSKLSS